MIVLSEADVAALLPMETALDIVAKAMITVSAGGATLPLRSIMPVGGGNMLGMMPGAMTDPATYGIKLVCLFPENPSAGYSSHQGAMVLFEPEHGAAVAMMNAGHLTAVRTAAASGVATRALARENASILAIIGTGEQAVHHLDAMAAVRPISELRVVGRRSDRAEAFAEAARSRHPTLAVRSGTDAQAALQGADIVCTVTSSASPVLESAWIDAGTHVNAVGASIPSKMEIPTDLVARAALFADYRPSLLAQAGEVIAGVRSGVFSEDHVRGEIGEVLTSTVPGRTGDEEITLYRSLGIAAQDLACADHCYRAAKERGLGVEAPLD